MSGWFTVEQVAKDSWVISEYKHWEETHCYLLAGEKRALLLDTGLGVGDLRRVVEQLTDLTVTVLTTHVHWDHIGGHGEFEHIWVYKNEAQYLSGHFPLPLETVKRNLTCHPCEFPKEFDLDRYKIYSGGAERTVSDGEVIDLGGRSLEVLHTPGHAPGHICLWEKEHGWLFSGDLLYLGCLDAFYPSTDPVAFYHSVEKVAELNSKRIWPGHHSLKVPRDLPQRVADGFASLEREGRLYQGAGIFSFQDFQIHL